MRILVTGGTGYIGSHFVVVAMQAGMDVVIVDSLENSSATVVDAIESVVGKRPFFYKGVDHDVGLLNGIFTHHKFDAVIHFAGYKSVAESTREPMKYYRNNVGGTAVLMEIMRNHDVSKLVFSSSATIYGMPQFNPYTEGHPIAPFNVYGHSKAMVETMMQSQCGANSNWSAIALRYFNPVGAHPSGDLGEDPKGTPDNLMPYLTKVAVGALPELGIFGDNYDTIDGTGVRDYIHVMDLAEGHLKALKWLDKHDGFSAVNLGTGSGYSVLQLVEAFTRVNAVPISYSFKPRRAGDLAAYWADSSSAYNMLGWKATRTLDDMVRDSWCWQSRHPNGYEDKD